MEGVRAIGAWMAILLVPVVSAQRESLRPAAPRLDLEPLAWRDAPTEPVLAGGHVLVSSTLRLFALDAATGALSWSAGPPPGWETLAQGNRVALYEAIAFERLFVTPAVGTGIVVAALQVPLARNPSREWQGIPISAQLPERRLFAFELASGRPLWSHAPPPDWDGVTGEFPQRMSLVASPLVVGSRVLVSCTADASSIDHHVACYRLETGELQWTTFVVRGQIERGSLGAQLSEFASSPLVAARGGERVLAQTGLGTMAALDVATGRILWQTEYTPIPFPKSRSYTPARRVTCWRTAPPLVVGDVVLATPWDSAELTAFGLADGRLLWSASVEELSRLDTRTDPLRFDHLIGADGDTLYLGGDKVSALRREGGWSSGQGWRVLWTRATPEAPARGRLVGDALFVPTSTEVLELAAASGEVRRSHAVARARGLLVTDVALFALGGNALLRLER